MRHTDELYERASLQAVARITRAHDHADAQSHQILTGPRAGEVSQSGAEPHATAQVMHAPASSPSAVEQAQVASGASAADRASSSWSRRCRWAGIVLGPECSRLACDNADWQQWIKACAPAGPNDRLLLCVKTRSASSSCTTCRPACARAAGQGQPRRARAAAAGRAVLRPGRHRDPGPDTAVRAAVTRLFTTFEATGSATAVVRTFAAEKLTFPVGVPARPRAGDLYWKPLWLDHAWYPITCANVTASTRAPALPGHLRVRHRCRRRWPGPGRAHPLAIETAVLTLPAHGTAPTAPDSGRWQTEPMT